MLYDFGEIKNKKLKKKHYMEAYSPKLDRIVILNNELEYDNWVLLESDPGIVEYCEQPIKIKYHENGFTYVTKIDIWFKKKNNEVGFIKLDYDDAKSVRYNNEILLQKRWCRENGFSYMLLGRREITSNEMYLNNMKHLLSVITAYKDIVDTDIKAIEKLIEENNRISIGAIVDKLNPIPYTRIRAAVYRMIYNGSIKADVKIVPLGDKTNVWQ
ncbi:MAG: hypothetical protein ACOZCL_13565 [Bacillota bacterium]